MSALVGISAVHGGEDVNTPQERIDLQQRTGRRVPVLRLDERP